MEATMEDCCVKVLVHIRPLIGDEWLLGCKDCVTVVLGKAQTDQRSGKATSSRAAIGEQKRLQNKKVLSQKKSFRSGRDGYD